MTTLDSSSLLRYLLADERKEAEKIDALIQEGATTTDLALYKAAGALEHVYQMPRKQIANLMVDLLSSVRIGDVLVHMEAFRLFAAAGLDYEQCLLYAYKELGDIGDIYSSDKKTQQVLADESLSLLPKKP